MTVSQEINTTHPFTTIIVRKQISDFISTAGSWCAKLRLIQFKHTVCYFAVWLRRPRSMPMLTLLDAFNVVGLQQPTPCAHSSSLNPVVGDWFDWWLVIHVIPHCEMWHLYEYTLCELVGATKIVISSRFVIFWFAYVNRQVFNYIMITLDYMMRNCGA